MKSNRIFIYIVVLLFFSPLIYSCEKDRKEQAESTSKKVLPGETGPDSRISELLASLNMHHFTETIEAPDFELNSLQGDRVSLSQYRGKVVMLSFWATW